MGAFDDAVLGKFRWAERHRDELDRVMNAWRDTKPVQVVKSESEFGVHRWVLHYKSAPPPDAGLILGDMVHNLRSVLDHIVCLLIRENGEEPTNWSAFPIEIEERRFWAKRGSGPRDPLGFVPDEWAEEVARWQPFVTHLDTPRDDPLAVLALLDNTDKHRNMLVTLTPMSQAHFTGTIRSHDTPTTVHLQWPSRPVLEEGEEAFRISTDPPAALDVELNPEGQFFMEVAADIGPVPMPNFFAPVSDIIDAFRPAFD